MRAVPKHIKKELLEICSGRKPTDRLSSLLRAYPQAAQCQNSQGQNALTIACQSHIADVQPLIDAWPESVRVLNWGSHALHHACYYYNTSTARPILQILRAWPGAAKVRNNSPRGNISGDLPLHTVCENGSLSVLEQVLPDLIAAWPDSVQVYGGRRRGRHRLLPLDIVCAKWHRLPSLSQHKILRWLSGGHPVLHFACSFSNRNSTIECCLTTTTTTNKNDTTLSLLQQRDSQGRLPLHCAALRQELSKIQLLLQMYPEAARIADWCGNLPLHAACHQARGLDVVECLVHAVPAGVCTANEDGFLPWYLASCSNAPLETVCFLVRGHPESVHSSYHRGE